MTDKEILESMRDLLVAERINTQKLLQDTIVPLDIRMNRMEALLDKMQSDMDVLRGDVDQIKEDTAITREAANSLVEWVDRAAGIVDIRYPVKHQ